MPTTRRTFPSTGSAAFSSPVRSFSSARRGRAKTSVAVGDILDCWLYDIANEGQVVIVTYGCRYDGDGTVTMSHEHKAVGRFTVAEVAALPMPEGYRRSIRDWHGRLAGPT